MPSLKNRIALVYLVTTSILLSLVYVSIYFSATKILYSHYDDDLRAEFDEVSSSMSIQEGTVYVLAQPEWTEREHGEVTVSPVFLQATDSNGKTLRNSPNLRDSRLTFLSGRNDTLVVTAELGSTWIRQIQGPLYSREGILEGYLLIGMGIAETELLLSYLKWIMLVSFPLMVGVIVFISRVFGGSIVRPVTALMLTADRISRENLQERVPLPKRADELQRLSATVNDLLDRLQEVILREQSFAADAAHELRTPLAVLKGTIEVLIRQPREPKQYEKKLRYCIVEIDRMSGLVDQLLLVARYESRKSDLKPITIDVAEIVAGVLERLEPITRTKRMSFRLSFCDRSTVVSSPLLLNTVLENVLSNAIKYSPEGSQVAVEVADSDRTINFSVTDKGSGLTPEQIDKIFDRFYRAESATNQHSGGFGLGLALVRRLCVLLGIKISIVSNPGRGTTFLLEIPK